MSRYESITILAAGFLVLSGCAGQKTAGPGYAIREDCVVLDAPGETADTITVTLAEQPGHFYFPESWNDETRIIAGCLYETLIGIDCNGKVDPGLATEWYPGDNGKRWTFRLSSGVTFTDGTPLESRHVVDWWQSGSIEPHIWTAGVDSVAASGPGEIHVYFATSRESLPLELSSLLFAVAKPGPGPSWPLGTGGMMMDRAGTTLRLVPAPGRNGPVLLLRRPPGRMDARDSIEKGTDILVTRDVDVIEYASARSHLATVPLPPDRTYAILAPSRVRGILMGEILPGISSEFSERLAADAVPVAGAVHEMPGWWEKADDCELPPDAPTRMPLDARSGNRIVFDSGDPVARSIAERIYSLSVSGCDFSPDLAVLAAAIPELPCYPGGLELSAMSKNAMAESLELGNEFIYIVWLPVRPPDPCSGMRTVAAQAPWLSDMYERFGDALLPLIDTRRYLIAGHGSAGILTDWSGNIKIMGVSGTEVILP